ncbi:uncharacterized protein LOC126834169 [Adelges cooleyi]|uniref:uncharacterized protein LOC126834169 n=1 Tax=Adelges cooleyi TaxID=133065 RepID=UPI00217F8A0D|nr:uncharacterized protein LOC126834169 [Adelges cooleyi]
MATNVKHFVSCIKICGNPIIPPLISTKKRQEMRDYKEKALALEQKLKGKRVSMDSGVMTASTEMQKIDNPESPISINKEPIIDEKQDVKTDVTHSIIFKNNEIGNPETPISNSNIKKVGISNILFPQQNQYLTTEGVSLVENSSGQENTENSSSITVNDFTPSEDEITDNTDNTPRLRSNSYTLLTPSPVMVAFLNSQIQQQLIKPKCLDEKYFSVETKSEPPSICNKNRIDEHKLTKSSSLCSIPEPINNEELLKNFEELKKHTDKSIYHNPNTDQKQHNKESISSSHGTNLSNDESLVGSVITVYNGINYENDSSLNSTTRHCCCKQSDDESINGSIHYKTPDELKIETERLRKAKLDIENRHQQELSNLIKKQREEQEQIAVRYYLISQSSSGISIDGSEYSETFQKSDKNSLSIQSETTLTNDKSVYSDTSSINSNYSINKSSIACSSPRLKTPLRSPSLQQNIKFYHRIRSGSNARWSKAPTDVENSAATVINAGVRGYLTRRLLKTEKAQMLKKTILDSLKTALLMHAELKKQQPTESDLDLHRRIINQLTTACYDLNDLILGSVHERMAIIRGDRERLKTIKLRRKSTPVISHKTTPTLRQLKKSSSGYSLSKKTSGHYSEKNTTKNNL